MKRVLLLTIMGLTTLVAFGQKKETRAVPSFTGISASSVFDITVTKGNTESLTIETDDEVMQYVRSEVKNGVLNLYVDDKNRMRNIKTLKANIVMKNLDKVILSGVSKFTSNDLFTPDNFKGECSGVSNMEINLNTGKLNLEASGASVISIKGNITNNIDLDVSGTSKILGDLKATNVKVNSSGVSTVELTGSAADFKIDASGVSKILAEDFVVKTATIESSGSVKITVNVTDVLNVNSSGASSVNYKGSPTIKSNSSFASKIRKI